MVAARPTTRAALYRVRRHNWSRTRPVCRDCGLELTDDLALLDVPECPGPDFTLRQRTLPDPVDATEVDDKEVEAMAEFLLGTEALTANTDGTPDHYVVEAGNVEHLVRTVLAARAHVTGQRT